MFPFWKDYNLESLNTIGKKVEVVDVFNVKIKLEADHNIPERGNTFSRALCPYLKSSCALGHSSEETFFGVQNTFLVASKNDHPQLVYRLF